MSTITIETRNYGTFTYDGHDPHDWPNYTKDTAVYKMVAELFDKWYRQYKNRNCAISNEVSAMYGEGGDFTVNRENAIHDGIYATFNTISERKLETVTQREIDNTFDLDDIFRWR